MGQTVFRLRIKLPPLAAYILWVMDNFSASKFKSLTATDYNPVSNIIYINPRVVKTALPGGHGVLRKISK